MSDLSAEGAGLRISSVSLHSSMAGQAAATHTIQLRRAFDAIGVGGGLLARRPGESLMRGLLRLVVEVVRGSREVDVLYLRSHPVAVVLVLLARLLRVPVVMEVNGTTEDLFAAHPVTRAGAWILRWADRLSLRLSVGCVAVSASLSAWCEEATAGRVPCVTVANGADLELFRPDVAMDPPDGGPYVAFCGALAPWQGIDVLLEAVKSPCWPDGLELVVAGDGVLRKLVESSAANGRRVRYVGPLAHEAVPSVVAGSVAVVSPNTRTVNQGSPMKLYEALACGVPVVASDVAGQAEVIRDLGAGLLYPPHDADALATAVEKLHNDPDLRARLRRNAIARRAELSWEARAEDIVGFVVSVLGRTASSSGNPSG